MKKLKVLLSVVAMSFVMVGCGGGGGSSLPEMDNSKVGAIEIFDGYYAGEDVLFAGVPIVGSWWNLQPEEEGSKGVLTVYSADGDAQVQNDRSYSYGVSQDGMKIRLISFVVPTTITYKGTRQDYMEKVDVDGVKTTHDCYDIEWQDNYGIFDVVMCP